jgi:hypothetical protein
MTRFRLCTGLFFALVVSTAAVAPAQATEVGGARTFGLGFQIGDPTAIIGKLFLGSGNAIDFGVGFAGFGYSRCRDVNNRWYYCSRALSVHGDFLWQENIVRGTAKLDWHIGVGGRVVFNSAFNDGRDDVLLIARMPLGLDLTFARPHFIEVFFEIAPGLIFIPELWFDVDAAIGVRFYF